MQSNCLKRIISNKTIGLLAHGKSLTTLESRIQEFKDLDIIWCGMNYFNPSEEIIKKINKEFTIVFDCSTVKNAEHYEKYARLPRLIGYLSRSRDNYFITLKESLLNLWQRIGTDFPIMYKDKIIYGEDLIPTAKQFCVSLHLYIACLIKLGAKRIILFGADGADKDNTENTYYKANIVLQDRSQTGNTFFNVVGDTHNVNASFEPMMKSIFGDVPIIFNCSPNSNYTIFRTVSYDEVIENEKLSKV